MALFLSTLISPLTKEQALEDVIEVLDSLGFTASAWQSGSPQLRFIMMFADVYSRLTVNISNLATFGFNELAQDQVLTLLSLSHFDNERIPARAAEGILQLSEVAGEGPHEFKPGDLVFSDEDNQRTYRNVEAFQLNPNQIVGVKVVAEVAGIAGNVAANKITQLVTDLPGVEVTNLSDWLTRAGVDEESDEQLRERNRTKWATLGPNSPTQAYVNWALSATDDVGDSAGISRVLVDAQNPDGPGTLWVYVATNAGTASPEQVNIVQEYTDARKPITADVTVKPAVEKLVTVRGTFVVEPGLEVQSKAAIEAAIANYLNALPIGGTVISGNGYAVFSEIVAAAMSVSGVRRVIVTEPTADVALASNEVATVDVAFEVG